MDRRTVYGERFNVGRLGDDALRVQMAYGEFPFHSGHDHGRGVNVAVNTQRQCRLANDALADALAVAVYADQFNGL